MKSILLTILLSVTFSLHAYNSYFVCRVAEISVAPTIDGKIEPAEWKDAAKLPAFSNSTGILASPKPIDLLLCYDKENLYIAFRTAIDWEAAVNPIPFDSFDIWSVDCLEIALIPRPENKNDVIRLITERGGGYTDLKAKGQVKQPSSEWNPAWRRAGRLIAQSYMSAYTWEQELSIPWKTLGISSPAPGMMIPAQFLHCFGNIRKKADGNPDRVLTWAPVPKGRDWLNPGDFGELHFDGPLPVFRADSEPVFGVKGACTRPIKGELSGLLWQIGKSGQPLRTAKRLSVDGMHIDWPEKVQTNSDINAMMYWKLTDEHGTVAAGRYTSVLQPLFNIQASINYQEEKLIALGDLSELRVNGEKSIRALLKSTAGQELAKKDVRLSASQQIFELEMGIKGIKAGTTADLTVLLADGKGIEKASATQRMTIQERPAWMSADALGKVTVPPPGWTTPVVEKTSGAIRISTGCNRYQFGAESVLPEEIWLRGRKFSAGSFVLKAITESGEQRLLSNRAPLVTAEDARGVSLELLFSSSELEVKAQLRVEFDGMAWYRMQVIPLKKGIHLKALSLVLPLDHGQVRYMRANNAMNVRELVFNTALVGMAKSPRPQPQPGIQFAFGFSGNGWTFGELFHNFYWLGCEDRGFFFVLPSCKNMAVTHAYSSTVDTPERFEATFNLIDRVTALMHPLDYEFGFFLTPTKEVNHKKLRRAGSGYIGKIDNAKNTVSEKPDPASFTGNARGRFFYDKDLKPFKKDDVYTLLLPCWKLRTLQNGNPRPPKSETDCIALWVANHKNRLGTTMMLWHDAFFTAYQLPETARYLPEFESWPVTRLPVEMPGTYVCPVQAWQNFYLTGVQERMKQGVSSFYMDLTFLKPCSNRFHGCGYRDDKGRIQGRVPLLEAREMFLRYQTLVKKNNPDGILYLHGYAATPLALWVDVITAGEEWLTAPDYSTLTPEYFQSMYMATAQLGTAANFFPGQILMHYIQAQRCKATLGQMCGLSFVHGESLWNGTAAMMPGLRMVWDALDSFGIDDAQWRPYWRHTAADKSSPVLVSSWKKSSGELFVLYNPADKEACVELKGHASYLDALNGNADAGKSISVPACNFRMILAK